LTKRDADRELPRLMESVRVPPSAVDVAETGRRNWLGVLD